MSAFSKKDAKPESDRLTQNPGPKIDMSLPTSTPGPKRLPEPPPTRLLELPPTRLHELPPERLPELPPVRLPELRPTRPYIYTKDRIMVTANADVNHQNSDRFSPLSNTRELSLPAPNVNINEKAVCVLRRAPSVCYPGRTTIFCMDDVRKKLVISSSINPAIIRVIDDRRYNMSPLCQTMLYHDVSLARYFLENMLLTSSDLSSVASNNLRRFLHFMNQKYCLNKISSHPLALLKASSENEAVEASAGRNMSQSGVEMDFVMLYKSKLRAVVNQVWLAERELLNGNSFLNRKVAKLSTLKDSLASFSEVVEKVHAFYSAKSLGHLPEVGLPPLEEIERLQFVIRTLNNTLTLNQIPALISVHSADRLRPTEDDIVCAISGLSPWVSEWLSDLDPGMRDHQPILYYIKNIVDVLATERGTDDTADDKAYVLKSLQCFGFTLNTAALIYRNIPIDILNTQTPAFWAKRYLDHTYNYNPLLNTCPRYPYSGDIVGSWFTCDIRQGPGHETDKHGTINMMNVSEDCKKKINFEAEVAKLISAGDDHQVLYHGTDHKSALKIISQGIILQNGGKCQDFSHSDGFYLSEDFHSASVWRRAPWAGYQAIIVYKIDKHLLDADEQNGYDLTNNKAKWEEVVLCCRNGYVDKKIRKELKDVTFIRGPMCLNPQDLSRERPSGFGRGHMQVCVRGEAYAEKFGALDNIGCVLFY